MVKIAVDAMGGDHAPAVVIEGVVDYIRENTADDIRIVLVGKEKEILKEMKKYRNFRHDRVEIVNAREEISMKEHFLTYWRKREETSIKKAIDLVKSGKAQAMVSAGNTGAVMALAKTSSGTMQHRPSGAGHHDADAQRQLAAARRRRQHRFQAPQPGAVRPDGQGLPGDHRTASTIPRIGLMNIGEEEVKGNELTKTHPPAAQEAGHQLHRQRRRPRHSTGGRRPDRHRRLHRQRHPEGYRRGGGSLLSMLRGKSCPTSSPRSVSSS